MLIFSAVPWAPQMSGLISRYYKQAALPGGNSLAGGFLFVCFGFGGLCLFALFFFFFPSKSTLENLSNPN